MISSPIIHRHYGTVKNLIPPIDLKNFPGKIAMPRWASRLSLLLLLASLTGLGGIWLWRDYQARLREELLSRPLPAVADIHIPAGSSARQIAQFSAAAGVPVDITTFIALAKHLQIDSSLRAGRYRFAAGVSVQDILSDMAAGNVIAERLTIVEGKTAADLRTMLTTDERIKNDLAGLSDADLRRTLNIEYDATEGLFMPNTYFFEEGHAASDILRRAHDHMTRILTELWPMRSDDSILSSPYEALTLASIVEKETGVAEERPLIASVFVNRLRRGIPLQSDPTVIYGLGDDFDGNLTRSHLRDKSNRYNTYAHRGLPPTPIALPSRAALEAVLNPPDAPYYYFVATGDGRHVFSKTLREHNNAVNKYQRQRS